jgi:hypothetical protein
VGSVMGNRRIDDGPETPQWGSVPARRSAASATTVRGTATGAVTRFWPHVPTVPVRGCLIPPGSADAAPARDHRRAALPVPPGGAVVAARLGRDVG